MITGQQLHDLIIDRLHDIPLEHLQLAADAIHQVGRIMSHKANDLQTLADRCGIDISEMSTLQAACHVVMYRAGS